ncbi:MAG: hypothetical protein JWO78_1877, partial [Micavibrio sp.]|nr:hypothetical protein [Micavibrio sp.]
MQGVFRDSSGHAREKGFTLIEIAIGMIIIGLLAVPYLQTYQAWKLKTITKETSDNASAVQSALAKYATRYGHYPLPANPSLASGAAGDGVEVAVGGVGTCSLASTGVCRSTTTWTGAHGQTTVLIGTVPYATLGLPLKNTYDGYKNRFKYAVTELMTKAPPTYTFSNDDGILQVVDKDGNDEDSQTKPDWQFCSNQNSNCNFTGNQQVLYGTSITDSTKYFIKQNMTSTPCTDAVFGDPHVGQLKKCWVAPMPKAHAKHFVIISHGADRKGAFSLTGIQTVPCTPLTAPQAKDDINCRNTPIYNSNKASDGSGGRSTPLDANHYDDYILSTATLEQGSWVQKTGQTDVYSNLTASGNILISPSLTYNGSGVVAPEARLQVEGG